jgi:hypothetical protein
MPSPSTNVTLVSGYVGSRALSSTLFTRPPP